MVIICIVLFPFRTFTQIDNHSIENFFIEEGFPIIRILHINQDKDGLMWFCSENQLYSYNGSQFNLELEFSNSDFALGKILFDNNGNKWLLDVSQPAYYAFHWKINKIKIFDANNKPIDPNKYIGSDFNNIAKIYQNSKGVIIYKIGKEYFRFDQSKTKLSLPEETNSIVYSNDKIALINHSTGASIINLKTHKSLIDYTNVRTYKVREHNGKIYIRFSNGEFHSFDLAKQKSQLISQSILKINKTYSDFFFDNSGSMWFIKLRSLSLFDLENNIKIDFNSNDAYPSLPYNTTAFKDREGNIWVGTNLGVNKITGHKNKMFKTSDPFNFSTRKVIQINEEELFVSTYSGQFVYNLKSSDFQKISETEVIFEGINDDGFYYVIDRNNELKKVILTPYSSQKTVQFDIKYNAGRYPGTLLKLSTGKKYLVLCHSIYEFDNDLNYKTILNDETNELFYHKAYEISNEIYILTNKGIYVYDTNFNIKKQLLEDFSIKLLHQDLVDPNILWLSTSSEFIKYNIRNDTYKKYDTETGFINTNFTAIKEDSNGNLWLPSYAGLNRFDKKNEINQVYLFGEGISNNEFNHNSSTTLYDGRIVLGSISGLTFLDTEKLIAEPLKTAEVNISSCKMLTSNLDTKLDLTDEVKKTGILKFKEKYIESSIQLSHHSYKNLKSKQFKYRIMKMDSPIENEPWIYLNSNVIQLGRKPYGKYILQFQANSRYGNTLSEINKIEVHYIKPFYKTVLVISLVILLFLFSLYYFFQQRSQALIQQKLALETEVTLRTQQIQKQKQELENLIRTKDKLFSILAHDLKSPLITLKNISGKINYLIKKGQPNRIIEIGKTIEDKVSNLNIFLDNLLNWSLQQRGHISYKPQKLSIQNITSQTLTLYADLIQEKKITIVEKIPLNSSCYADENSIKTVVRNIIHNAIKYTPIASTITIKFRVGDEYSILAIGDSGAGIPQATIDSIYKKENIKNTLGTNGETGTGLGFLISKELMDLNKGQMVFITNQSKGTTVELMLPILEE